MSWQSNVSGILVLSGAVSACITNSVPPNAFVSSAAERDAAVDAGKSAMNPDASSGVKRDAGIADEPDANTQSDAGTDPPSGPGVDNGPCDLTGAWLITQRGVHQAFGVRQTAMSWYYYELEQSGGNLTVKKGLACGGKVVPLDLLGAGVEWEAGWQGILEHNSHAGRLGKVTSSGTDCSVSFDPTYSILGASTPYYMDPAYELPTLDEKAAGDTPGWEDWDNDGKPGLSFHLSGFATGTRYSIQRVLNDWTDGKYSPGATKLQLKAVTHQDESVLGATSDIIKALAVPDADPSGHFTQFAKLDADQAQGDDAARCATVRELAPMLTPEANQ